MNSPFRNHSLIVKRKTGGAFTNGKWAGEVETDIAFTCSLQPLSERDLLTLPEGRRTSETYRIFSDTELKTVEAQNPDEVVYNGERFEIYTVGKWQNQIINHFTYIIIKKSI